MTPPPLPVVDDTLCVGDGACVVACPTGSLALADGRPWLPRPRDCVGCGACAEVCPTGAVKLVSGSGSGYDPGAEEDQT